LGVLAALADESIFFCLSWVNLQFQNQAVVDENIRDPTIGFRKFGHTNSSTIIASLTTQFIAKELDQVIGVIVLSLIVWGLPIVKKTPHQLTDPFNAFGVVLLGLALSFLVVMTLNDRCAGNSAQSHGDGHLPRIYGVNWHWLLSQIFSQTSAPGTQSPRLIGKEFSPKTRNSPCYKFASHGHI
jgi:hypothetical protein